MIVSTYHIYYFLYNNVDWVLIGRYMTGSCIVLDRSTVSTSADCMLLSRTKYANNRIKQLYGYNNSEWRLICDYDTIYSNMNGSTNISNFVCISGNGQYIICLGTGVGLAIESVFIRTYQFT